MYLQPYLRFYYHQNEIIKEEQTQTQTRGERVTEIEAELLKMYSDPNLKVKPKELDQRGGGGYSLSALQVMAAIWNDENSIHIVNCRNNGTVQGLDDDASVEVPVVANKAGVFPLTIGKIPIDILPKLQVVKGYETLTAMAAMEGSQELALKALCLHPLVPSFDIAKAFLKDTLESHKEFLPNFFK
jgi:6-phospho-beta-glucosidase